MNEKRIGLDCSLYYIAFATVLEETNTSENIRVAYKIYENGIARNAKPVERLKKKLTYNGWELDYQAAQQQLLTSGGSVSSIRGHLHRLERAQADHDGDRSSKKLLKLDKLKKELTYPG